jgi:hypothetical protein
MRRRKPWVFARRRLFGWKVRLLTSGSVFVCFGGDVRPAIQGSATAVKADTPS